MSKGLSDEFLRELCAIDGDWGGTDWGREILRLLDDRDAWRDQVVHIRAQQRAALRLLREFQEPPARRGDTSSSGLTRVIASHYVMVGGRCTCRARGFDDRPAHQAHVAAMIREAIEPAIAPCYMFRSSGGAASCVDLIGGTFDNGAEFKPEMCCDPCKVRLALDHEPRRQKPDAEPETEPAATEER